MNIYKVIFSPTGGTDKVAHIVANEFDSNYKTIDISEPDFEKKAKDIEFSDEDLCIIAVPSFAGRVPQTATARLKAIKAKGALAVGIVVYGNRAYDDTLIELCDTLKEAEFKQVAAIAAIAEHSVVREIAAARPDENDAAKLCEMAKSIKENLLLMKSKNLELKVPGNKPYCKYSPVKIAVHTDESCIKCGECADKCPVGAIDKDNYQALPNESCIACLRCVAICHKGAKSADQERVDFIKNRISAACSDRKECELYTIKPLEI